MLETQTNATPLGTLATPTDVAAAVSAVIHHLPMTTGSIIPVDGVPVICAIILALTKPAFWWIDVEPTPGALVVNTGDMMQVWSNNRYQAALHRVAPRTDRARYSLPYFFNPSYDTDYAPLPGSVEIDDQPHYRSINWGQFRQARADGDFADRGAEVQSPTLLSRHPGSTSAEIGLLVSATAEATQ